MKVKVINKNLNDLQDNVFRPVGSVFECDKERAEYLLKNNAVEIEVEPEIIIDEEKIVKKVFEEQKPNKKKKTSKK